jgi:hypothetical protein
MESNSPSRPGTKTEHKCKFDNEQGEPVHLSTQASEDHTKEDIDEDPVRQDIRILTSFCTYLSKDVLNGSGSFELPSKHSVKWRTNPELMQLHHLARLLARRPHETVYAAWHYDPEERRPYPQLTVAMAVPNWWNDDLLRASALFTKATTWQNNVPVPNPTLRGLSQHLHILTHLVTTHRNLPAHQKKTFRSYFYEYSLNMCFEEFRHRMRFGIDHSSFYDFFCRDPPDFPSIGSMAVSEHFQDSDVVTQEAQARACKALANTMRKEWRRICSDAVHQSELPWTQEIMVIADAAFRWVEGGLFEVNGMKLVHLIIRLRLRWIYQALETTTAFLDETQPSMLSSSSTIPLWKLQLNFHHMYQKLYPIIWIYLDMIEKAAGHTLILELPDMWRSWSSSNYVHQASNEVELKQDDSNHNIIRNRDTWAGSLSMWLLQIRQHSAAAVEIIHEKNGRRLSWVGNEVKFLLLDNDEPIKTHVIPDESEQVVTSPFISGTGENNSRLIRALKTLCTLDPQYDVLRDIGSPCIKSVGAHLVQHIIDVATPVHKRNTQHHYRIKPLFGCNRRIPFAEAVAMEIMVKEAYGSPQRWDENRDQLQDDDRSLVGQTAKLTVDPKIEGMDLPVAVSVKAAESILARLKLEVRHRLGRNLWNLEERARQIVDEQENTQE